MTWCAGKVEDYSGEAVNPANLSWFESMLGVGKPYRSKAADAGVQIKQDGSAVPVVSAVASNGATTV